MNTKKALSLILLVSLLSQGNVFGMFKSVASKLSNAGRLSISRKNIMVSSKVVLSSKFSTGKSKTKKVVRPVPAVIDKPKEINKKGSGFAEIKNYIIGNSLVFYTFPIAYGDLILKLFNG